MRKTKEDETFYFIRGVYKHNKKSWKCKPNCKNKMS